MNPSFSPFQEHRRPARSRFVHSAFVVAVFVAVHPSAGAQTAGDPPVLTLERALQLAQLRSAGIVAEDAAATAARSMSIAAGQLPDPTLTVGLNNLPVNGPDQFSVGRDFMTMRSIGIAQEFTRSSKLKARAARFEREAQAAEAAGELTLANLQRDTALAWLDRYFEERVGELMAAQRDEAKLQIDAAETAYHSARGSQADVFAARSALARIEDRLAQSQRDLGTARTQLARWVGAPADEALGPLPALETVSLRPEDLETALVHHPQIAMMLEQEAAAQAEADEARANKRPDLSVALMYSQRGSTYSNMVSINVSIPLQWDQRNRQDQELAAKLALIRKMRAEREEETRMHVAEALAMLQQWRSDRERLGGYDASLLPLAADRIDAALAAYRGGTGSLTSVLEARRTQLDTRLESLRLKQEAARLWAQLNYLAPAGHGAAQNPQ
ncbi:MAG TPA: TolC family protein [Burkholderiaceae bacterium]|nr:TolC family protein [Burkholderiaceae bacterium]